MTSFPNLKRIVFLSDTSAYFKHIRRDKIYPFLYNGAWFISADIDQMDDIKLIMPNKVEVTRRNLKNHVSKLYFKFEIFSDYLLISPI